MGVIFYLIFFVSFFYFLESLFCVCYAMDEKWSGGGEIKQTNKKKSLQWLFFVVTFSLILPLLLFRPSFLTHFFFYLSYTSWLISFFHTSFDYIFCFLYLTLCLFLRLYVKSLLSRLFLLFSSHVSFPLVFFFPLYFAIVNFSLCSVSFFFSLLHFVSLTPPPSFYHVIYFHP